MRRRRHPAAPALAVLVGLSLAAAPQAEGGLDVGRYVFDPGGRVAAVRALDVDGDGRRDLVLLVSDAQDGHPFLLVLRSPEKAAGRQYYPADAVVRIPCEGPLASAGAVALGRFGADGGARLRFLGPRGITEVRPDGARAPGRARLDAPTLFARSPGRLLFFWDGVADLDGDGRDELWFPLASGNGPMQVLGGTPDGDRLLALEARNRASASAAHLLERAAFVPNLFPADLDGDGRQELVALRGSEIVAWPVGRGAAPGRGALEPIFRLPLPFLEADPALGAEDVRTPRIQLADVDGDGVTDLLVTLITGRRSRLDSFRTIFFHYPGPFRRGPQGGLVRPRVRLDTQSIVLHPTFLDLDGDGDLDYVGDSIRGSRWDLIARVLGKDPEITYVGFRFDGERGTYEAAPYFTVERAYASSEAVSNRFGRSAWFGGDFDGDGHADLLDLGNLKGVEIVRAMQQKRRRGGDPVEFTRTLLGPLPVKEGLSADAVVTDLNADGRTDVVLWSDSQLYLIVSGGGH